MIESMPPPDHVPEGPISDHENDGSRLKNNLKSHSTWLRLLFMILFLALWSISRVVIFTVIVIQFFWILIDGETNSRLVKFGQVLATYSYQIIMYLTFNTEKQPFPFSDWPSVQPD